MTNRSKDNHPASDRPTSDSHASDRPASSSPVFARALGEDWSKISPLVRRHYDLAPHSDAKIAFEGEMTVWYPRPALIVLAFVRLIGGLVLLRQKGLKVRVENNSRPNDAAMHWRREFHPPSKNRQGKNRRGKSRWGKNRADRNRPIIFRSRMEYAGGRNVIEYVGYNVGVKMQISAVDGAIHYRSTGYVLKFGPLFIPLPGHLLLGRALISEEQRGDDAIAMRFEIKHPLWGTTYSYSGRFTQAAIAPVHRA